MAIWKAHSQNAAQLSDNRINMIILHGNAYSSKTSNHKGAIIVCTSSTFTTAPILIDHEVSDDEYLRERHEAEEYLFGNHK